jgi:hypothetical protein
MVSYGLLEGDEEESIDTPPETSQTRKRTYPNAFPEEEDGAEQYPYNNTIPVVIQESQEWNLPLGLTPNSLMDCFKTALRWIVHAIVDYGGKFFATGIYFVNRLV